jgi:hypothetical protein
MSEPAKILRIGVVQGGKVTETRLIRRRETITVGAGPTNTFAIQGTGLSASFPLLEIHGGIYSLRFTDRMDGRVWQGDEAQVPLASLVSQGMARKGSDGSFTLALSDNSKGKIQFGDTALMFQFVTPPPEPQKAQLPEVARGGWRNFDRLFYMILAISLGVHFGLVSAISGRETNEDVSIDEIPDRFAKLIIPEKPVAAQQKKAEEAPAAEEKKVEKKEPPKKVAKKEDDDAAKAARRAKLEQTVAQRGLLKLLGADTGNSGAIDDVLSSGSSNSDIASALAGAGGVAVANADAIGAGGRKGGGSGKEAGIGDLATQGGGAVGLGQKGQTRVSASVSASAPEVESSTLDRDAVARYIKSRNAAIRSCYERELKLNPSLKGKLAMRITISTSGKVSEVEVDEDSLHSDAVASCIRGLIRFWNFPFKPEQDSAVQFSWNFVASQ